MFPPPGSDFFEAVLLPAAAGNRICRKMLFFSDFRRHVRQFFGVVLELARPSEAWCFPPRGDFFEAVLLQQPQATESVEICRKMLFFLGFQTKGWAFFWRGFGTSSSFRGMVFPPGGVFCEAVLLQQPQATESVEKCCFSRISDDTKP